MTLVDSLISAGVFDLAREGHHHILKRSVPSNSVGDTGSTAPALATVGTARILSSVFRSETSFSNLPARPSLFWKAYALALRSRLALDSDLSDVGQAMFIASPLQTGIPAGSIVDDAITNYQILLKADCIQKLNFPFYSIHNDSFFGRLEDYLRNVKYEGDRKEIEGVRLALLKANEAKWAAWKEDSSRYEQAKKAQPDITFIDWMTKNAVAYNKAWKEEDKLLQEFENLQDPSMADVARALETVKSASERLALKVNSNMPCVSADEDFTKFPGATVNPKDMYYQPLHALSNYGISVDKWIKMYKKGVFTGDLDLDFQSAKPITWAQFGHPALDEGSPSPSPEHDAVYDALEAKIQFTGLMAFDVSRGLWDVPELRNLPPLNDKAPNSLKQPFTKTTKLLLGYGVDVVVKLPAQVAGADIDKRKISLLNLPITSKNLSPSGTELHISAGDNAYPVLLAVLANVV